MAVTESQKICTVRARDKNPPKLQKERAKPGPKPKQVHHTAAHFGKDERCQDLTYAVQALMPDFFKLSISGTSLPSPIARDRHLKEAEKIPGDEASINELLNSLIEREDFDSEFLRFADGDAGEREILEFL
ncbi:hypothetical protein K438DRAFT_1780943 [Mycena galopus ATCC 62051]|nr:hypothetical protein K438DRAFT_1780943 [Mycena galopus ATCC 62051]